MRIIVARVMAIAVMLLVMAAWHDLEQLGVASLIEGFLVAAVAAPAATVVARWWTCPPHAAEASRGASAESLEAVRSRWWAGPAAMPVPSKERDVTHAT